jgi:hypothetical protein
MEGGDEKPMTLNVGGSAKELGASMDPTFTVCQALVYPRVCVSLFCLL